MDNLFTAAEIFFYDFPNSNFRLKFNFIKKCILNQEDLTRLKIVYDNRFKLYRVLNIDPIQTPSHWEVVAEAKQIRNFMKLRKERYYKDNLF